VGGIRGQALGDFRVTVRSRFTGQIGHGAGEHHAAMARTNESPWTRQFSHHAREAVHFDMRADAAVDVVADDVLRQHRADGSAAGRGVMIAVVCAGSVIVEKHGDGGQTRNRAFQFAHAANALTGDGVHSGVVE
jgi:hypothetical protein